MNIEDFYKDWSGKSIAVVGSGAFNRDYGKEIDGHDVVIRFNCCVVDGFEKKVGEKISVICLGGVNFYGKFSDCVKECDYIFSHYYKDLNEKLPEKMYLPREFYWDEMKIITESRKPTAGFRCLYHMFKNKVFANVYGFDFYKHECYYKDVLDRIEYYKTHEYDNYAEVHNYEQEKKFWNETNWFHFVRTS